MMAVVACAMLSVSCTTVTDRAAKYANDMASALQSYDEQRQKMLPAEIVEYSNILSSEERSEFISVFNKVCKEAGFDEETYGINDMYVVVDGMYKASTYAQSLVKEANNLPQLAVIFAEIREYQKSLPEDSFAANNFQYTIDKYLQEAGQSFEDLLVKSVNGCGCGAAHNVESAQ